MNLPGKYRRIAQINTTTLFTGQNQDDISSQSYGLIGQPFPGDKFRVHAQTK